MKFDFPYVYVVYKYCTITIVLSKYETNINNISYRKFIIDNIKDNSRKNRSFLFPKWVFLKRNFKKVKTDKFLGLIPYKVYYEFIETQNEYLIKTINYAKKLIDEQEEIYNEYKNDFSNIEEGRL